MLVKIDSYYTREEIRALGACLVTSGLLSVPDLDELEATFNRYATDFAQLNFFSINHLLLPFLERFAGYNKSERDLFRFTHDLDSFYRNLTLRLLNGSPLGRHAPTCSIDRNTGELAIRAGLLEAEFNFSTHSEYLGRVTEHLNRLLQQDGADLSYYEVGFDEDTTFLLLKAWQYSYLVTNRVLNFSRIEYPEVEAWRKTFRKEDLPF